MIENDRLLPTSSAFFLGLAAAATLHGEAMNQFLASSFEFNLIQRPLWCAFAVKICSSSPGVTFLALPLLPRCDVTERTTDRDRTGQLLLSTALTRQQSGY
jgi:hypothetical protein